MSGWTNKELNTRFGITQITDVVKRPVFDEEIRFRPNRLSAIPPQHKRFRLCPVCTQLFELDERKLSQNARCPNGHGFIVQRKGNGANASFYYKYIPGLELGTRFNQLNIAPLVEAVQSGKRKVTDKVW